MLKKITVALLATSAWVACSNAGQGTVNFHTQLAGTNALVYDDVAHTNVLVGTGSGQGTNFFAQLYGAPGTAGVSILST